MKLYVDELPKCCRDCPCAIESQRQQWRDKKRKMDTYMEDCMHCIPLDKWIVKRPKNCPLQSIDELKKQIRKEVVQEIRELAKNNFEFLVCDECYNTVDKDVYISSVALTEILDQIEGGWDEKSTK